MYQDRVINLKNNYYPLVNYYKSHIIPNFFFKEKGALKALKIHSMQVKPKKLP